MPSSSRLPSSELSLSRRVPTEGGPSSHSCSLSPVPLLAALPSLLWLAFCPLQLQGWSTPFGADPGSAVLPLPLRLRPSLLVTHGAHVYGHTAAGSRQARGRSTPFEPPPLPPLLTHGAHVYGHTGAGSRQAQGRSTPFGADLGSAALPLPLRLRSPSCSRTARMSTGTQVQEAGRHRVGACRWSRPWLCGVASPPSPPLPLLLTHGRACLRAHRCRKPAGTGSEHAVWSRPWLCGAASPPSPPLPPLLTHGAHVYGHIGAGSWQAQGRSTPFGADLGSAALPLTLRLRSLPCSRTARMSKGTQVQEAGRHRVGARRWSRPWLCGVASPPSPPLPLLLMHWQACLRAHRCRKLAGTGPEHSVQSRPWLCGVASLPIPPPFSPGHAQHARLWAHRCRRPVGTRSEHAVGADPGSAALPLALPLRSLSCPCTGVHVYGRTGAGSWQAQGQSTPLRVDLGSAVLLPPLPLCLSVLAARGVRVYGHTGAGSW